MFNSTSDDTTHPTLTRVGAQSNADTMTAASSASCSRDGIDTTLASAIATSQLASHGAAPTVLPPTATTSYTRFITQLKQQGTGGGASRCQIVCAFAVSDDVIVAYVARYALGLEGQPIEPRSEITGAFSEMALYVLVRRDGEWWLAAGQNTPIRPGGAV